MKKRFIYLLFVISLGTQAQGLVFGGTDSLETIGADMGSKANEQFPTMYDLSKFAPIAKNQGNLNTCVVWATVYGALATQMAASKNWQDTALIQSVALSPLFVYKQLSTDCSKSLNIEAAGLYVKNNGGLLFQKNPVLACTEQVYDGITIREAKKNNYIKSVKRLFSSKETNSVLKIAAIKHSLAVNQSPVVIGVLITPNFNKISAFKDVYRPETTAQQMPHALVLVGYDDNKNGGSFCLLNSYGTRWGKNGYCWVSYADLMKIMKEAIVLELNDPAPSGGQTTVLFVDDNEKKTSAVVFFDATTKTYQITLPTKHGEQPFQIMIQKAKAGDYLYVFRQNDKLDTEICFPKLENANLATITLPNDNNTFQSFDTETDYFCVLHSTKFLSNDELKERLEKMNNLKGNFEQKVFEAFGDKIVRDDIQYEGNKMSFVAQKSKVVPVIIKIVAHR